ncbi:threonyl-tRNA synthetase [Annulohypoxylon maeteangense]|uniref:threonyl-tRNA synthetase n=1 Tax=Annulohypoxylon maeteangense TaxID=1927788 RepID=UPI00200823E7|nr:threonyl-tRNA synthetase [Annulohypoxylon maeteangense]KAI0880208.1 threonyl-tRNA synthetase [Annulohypoxylon maeteangense]
MADAGSGDVKKVVVGGQKPTKKEKKSKAGSDAASAGPVEMNPPPDFLKTRLDLFDRLKKKYDDDVAKRPREQITITLPDGSIKVGTSWETTPGEIAKGVSNSLYKRSVVARLDGDKNRLWDLDRPLEQSCKLELLTFDDDQGKQVFWHSSAHILGEACERRFGCSLCIGPPIDDGFYYEMALPGGAAVQQSDWTPLERIVTDIVKDRQRFERLEVTKQDLLDMFSYNKYKQYIISTKIPDGTSTTIYRNGPLIDLCRGPHVPDTGRIEAFSIMKNSASYWLGSQENDSLQRIYGVSFPDKKKMVEHKKFLEEAAKRDHRKLGKEQELFMFHELSPGSAFFLPHGTRIYNTLLEYLRDQYHKRDYQEVITPNIFNSELWKISGHWEYYQEDMFVMDLEKEKWGLKPMNCPAHFLMFGHSPRVYNQLPLRFADFGVLHRNEASGALSGLTRVRRFQQDDSHIFCRLDQVTAEISDLFDFLSEMYGLLGFTFKLQLSTRPEKFMGQIETWDKAESMLKEALDGFAAGPGGVSWTLNEGDGAFYGPKIDIKILDCLNREWQCATIQLDFMGPENFGLEYITSEAQPTKTKQEEPAVPAADVKIKDAQPLDADSANPNTSDSGAKRGRVIKPLSPGCARPVIIHRAMAGSIERFMGILIEHFAGKWPFWLSPRQVMVIPVGMGFVPYAQEVKEILKQARIFVDIDTTGNTLPKKVRNAQLAQYNFVFVVGDEEMRGRQVNVRYRDDTSTQDRGKPVLLEEVVGKLQKLRADRGSYNPFPSSKETDKNVA